MSKSNLSGTPLEPKQFDGEHVHVPAHKSSTKSFQKGSQNLHMNSDVIPAPPTAGTNKIQKGSQRSAAGEGVVSTARKVKLGSKELRDAHADNTARESGNYDRSGGW